MSFIFIVRKEVYKNNIKDVFGSLFYIVDKFVYIFTYITRNHAVIVLSKTFKFD